MNEHSKLFFVKRILKEGKWFLIPSSIVIFYNIININIFRAHPTGLDWFILFSALFIFSYTIFFLRPPTHFPQENNNIIYASANGNILGIDENVTCPYDSSKKYNKITIFMNVTSMHWNQSPIVGNIMLEKFNKGKFKNAFSANTLWQDNEHQVIGIENKSTKNKIFVIMVAGLIARRIRFFRKNGDSLKQGDILGLIRYGSANIIYFPTDFKIKVSLKEKVFAGHSVLAEKSGEI